MNHVAYIIPSLDSIGGAEQQVLVLATGMARRNWRVSVIALSGTGGDAATSLHSDGAAFLSLQMRKGLLDPRGWTHFRRWIIKEQPDLVHAHLPHASLAARWSRLATPMRALVDTLHSPAPGSFLQRTAFRASAFATDMVTAVSSAAAQPWIESRSIDKHKLAVIPNGIDMNRWRRDDVCRRAIRREHRLDDQFVWFTAGRLHPVKGQRTMLGAIAKLPLSACLLIAGSGPLHNELHRLALGLGIQDRVRFLGFQKDVRQWMQAADAFVLSSQWEGLPLALIEASACELPSVITDIPGAREVLPDPDLCFVSAQSSPDSLALAMKQVMNLSEAGRRKAGQRARLAVVARCNLESVLARWESTYESLLGAAPYAERTARPFRSRDKTLQLQ